MRGLRTCVRLAWQAAPRVVAWYVAVTLVAAALPVAIAWLTKLVLDGAGAGAAAGTLVTLAIALAAAGLATAALPVLCRYFRAELDREARLVAKDRLYESVERFGGLARFEDPVFLDRMRLAQQSAGAPAGLVDATLAVGRAALTLIGLVSSLFVISPVMTGVLLLAGVPTLLGELTLARGRAAVQWKLGPTERREMFYGRLLSSVEAAKEIRLFGLGSFLRGRMITDARTSNTARRAVDRREARVHSGLALLAASVAGGGLVWAILAAGRHELTPGDITMFVAAVAGAQAALTELVSRSAVAHGELLLFEHYVTVLDAPPDLPTPSVPARLGPLRDGIELRDVWFRYADDHEWVLRGVTLRIPRGKAVGLVGSNGAGKSTLVKLLCRYYDPTRGSIHWDGTDIRDVPTDELRARISGVFQDYMQYELSAEENIALGDLAAIGNRPRIEDAARRAGMHDVLTALPRGYDTLLSRMFFEGDDVNGGDLGVHLSGGQWQRLAVARALLRNQPDLMILDEPSAGLDARAEHDLHAELRAHRHGHTSLLVSHRLGALRDADLIAVLTDGVITETGDHETLMAHGGTYADLFTVQAAGYQTTVTGQP